MQRSSGWPGSVISNAGIMLPGRQLRPRPPDGTAMVALSALRYLGYGRVFGKAGAVVAHQGSGDVCAASQQILT